MTPRSRKSHVCVEVDPGSRKIEIHIANREPEEAIFEGLRADSHLMNRVLKHLSTLAALDGRSKSFDQEPGTEG